MKWKVALNVQRSVMKGGFDAIEVARRTSEFEVEHIIVEPSLTYSGEGTVKFKVERLDLIRQIQHALRDAGYVTEVLYVEQVDWR